MKCLFIWWIALVSGVLCGKAFNQIKEYRKEDLWREEPTLLFIYYDGEDKGKCMACESYKPWISSLSGEIGAFSVKRLNFNRDPLLVLRFRTTHFPTFFLQHGRHFKNLTESDFFSLGIKYHKQGYANDVDAILRNPQVFDRIKTVSKWRSPASASSFLYAHGLSGLMMASYLVDQVNSVCPAWVILLGFFILLFIAGSLKRRMEKQEKKIFNVPCKERDSSKEKSE